MLSGAAAILGTLSSIVDNPSSIVTTLTNSLPSQSLFWVNYIITALFIYKFLALSRIIPLAIYALKTGFGRKTTKTRVVIDAREPFPLATTYAADMLIFSLGLVYSVFAPIIILATLVYFMVSYLAAKHHLLYVHKPLVDSTVFTPSVMGAATTALVIFQLLMIGMLGLLEFPYAALVLLSLIVTCCGVAFAYRKYYKICYIIPLNRAVEALPFKKTKINIFADPALLPPSSKLALLDEESTVGAPMEEVDSERRRRKEMKRATEAERERDIKGVVESA